MVVVIDECYFFTSPGVLSFILSALKSIILVWLNSKTVHVFLWVMWKDKSKSCSYKQGINSVIYTYLGVSGKSIIYPIESFW